MNKYSIAEIVGFNSISPLLFNDKDGANNILMNLDDNPSILNAVVLDKNGNEFARYVKKGEEHFSYPMPHGNRFAKEGLFEKKYSVNYPIFHEKELLGTILLSAELKDLNTIVFNYIKTGILILILSIFSAFLISNFLQRTISNRLLSLVSTTVSVAETHNYSIRISAQGKDEIGVLSEGFNNMLLQIEKTSNELELSLSLMHATLESTADGILVVDKEGKISVLNTQFKKLWNIPDEILETKDDNKVLEYATTQIKEPEKFLNKVKELYTKPELESFDVIEMKDGRTFERYSKPQCNAKGEIIGRVWSFRDVTIRNRAVEELRKSNEQLEQLVKERTSALTKANESLQLSEERYRKLVEEAGDVVYTSDYKGYFTYINPMSKKITGYSEKELIGKHFSEIIDPQWKEKVAKFYKEQFDNKIHETLFSFPITTKSGEKKWVEQTVIQFNVGGRVTGHQAIVRDITERKKVEDELKTSNERFYKIFDSNPVGMVISNLETKQFQYVNDVFVENFGFSKEEAIGKTSIDLNIINAETREKVVSMLNQQGSIKDMEILARKKNGETFWSLTSVQIIIINNKKFALTSFHNIAERKKAETELKQKSEELERSNKDLKYSEQQIQGIFNSAPDAVIVINRESTIIKWNYKAEKLFGWDGAEVIGKPLYDFIIPERYREKHKNGMKHYLATGEGPMLNKDIEIEALNRKGIEFSVLLTISPVGEKDKLLFIGFIRDITEKKKSELLIQQKSEELSRSNQELEQFAYVASHDLQEPLRTIFNFVGLLDKKYSGKTDKETEQYFKFIVNATAKMQNLIKDLLDYSRVGRNIIFTTIDCNKIFKEVITDLDASIKESNAIVSSSILPSLKGDEMGLKRLFQNLLSNAIKFRKKNSVPQIVITAEEKNTEYLFSFKDNGIGIEERFIPKLFIIFQRLHTDTEYPGTGIGLATCKKIVTLHGGKIWIESKFGEGSTFYFTIPKKN